MPKVLEIEQVLVGDNAAKREIQVLEILNSCTENKTDTKIPYHVLCYKLSKYTYELKNIVDDLVVYGYIKETENHEESCVVSSDIEITELGKELLYQIDITRKYKDFFKIYVNKLSLTDFEITEILGISEKECDILVAELEGIGFVGYYDAQWHISIVAEKIYYLIK